LLGEVDDEQGEEGFERNKTLTGVGTPLGWTVLGLEAVGSSFCFCFLMILGIKFGFSKEAGRLGSGFDLVYHVFFLGASF